MVIAPGEKGSEGAELASVGAPVDELMAKPARESFLVPAIKMNLPCESIVADTKIVNVTGASERGPGVNCPVVLLMA